jgi:ASC-1-like (ASCH) protein
VDDPRVKHFEKIGVQQQLFTRQQLATANRGARQAGLAVGDMMVQQGVLTREQLRGLERAVIYRMGRDQDKGIAKIIIDSHYCAADAVEEALRQQKEFYGKTGELLRLGVLLVKARDLSESQRVAAHKIHGIEQGSGISHLSSDMF